jgi:hypothetical protein
MHYAVEIISKAAEKFELFPINSIYYIILGCFNEAFHQVQIWPAINDDIGLR